MIVALLATGCAMNPPARDGAGMTQAQVSTMSIEDEFRLAGGRYEHGQAVLTDAQRQISDGVWAWNGGDVLPLSAGSGAFGDAPKGATADNTYSFRTERIIRPDRAIGAAEDLEPMQRYVEDKGWRSSSGTIGRNREVRADTGDGWWVTWTVRPNGQYSLGVYSEAFWTNDTDDLVGAIADRDPAAFPDESEPGVSEPFPKWSDPVRKD